MFLEKFTKIEDGSLAGSEYKLKTPFHFRQQLQCVQYDARYLFTQWKLKWECYWEKKT